MAQRSASGMQRIRDGTSYNHSITQECPVKHQSERMYAAAIYMLAQRADNDPDVRGWVKMLFRRVMQLLRAHAGSSSEWPAYCVQAAGLLTTDNVTQVQPFSSGPNWLQGVVVLVRDDLESGTHEAGAALVINRHSGLVSIDGQRIGAVPAGCDDAELWRRGCSLLGSAVAAKVAP